MFSPGVLLGNRYRLEERIASGGMGDVWRGFDDVLGRTVAVKILLPALLDEPGFADRFRGEARTMATVNHPGVVDIYDYGNDDQVAFLVMEHVAGDALNKTLGRVSRLTPARTMALIAQAAEALHAAHLKGVVHRDVKPGNLMVRADGSLVVIDFGIARSALVGQLTAAGSVLGTASYISPEQANGLTATALSDVYALGIVAYQCLAGRRPFVGDNPVEIAMKHARDAAPPMPADIPPPVRAIVERAMAKDPSARFPTAAAMAIVARQAALSLVNGAAARPSGTARPSGSARPVGTAHHLGARGSHSPAGSMGQGSAGHPAASGHGRTTPAAPAGSMGQSAPMGQPAMGQAAATRQANPVPGQLAPGWSAGQPSAPRPTGTASAPRPPAASALRPASAASAPVRSAVPGGNPPSAPPAGVAGGAQQTSRPVTNAGPYRPGTAAPQVGRPMAATFVAAQAPRPYAAAGQVWPPQPTAAAAQRPRRRLRWWLVALMLVLGMMIVWQLGASGAFSALEQRLLSVQAGHSGLVQVTEGWRTT